jgi:hypothetical protein
MKMKIPKLGPGIGASHHAKPLRLPHRAVKTAFGQGKTAFNPPSTAVVPDQAFAGAMGLPQGDSAPLTPPPAAPEG